MNHPVQQSASPSPAPPHTTRARASLSLVKAPRLVRMYQEGEGLFVQMSDGSRWQLIQSPGSRTPWEVAGIRPATSLSD